MARNLLQDDGEWWEAMSLAAGQASAYQIRDLYLFIVEWNKPDEPSKLFDEFWECMSDDFANNFRNAGLEFTEESLQAFLKLDLQKSLESHGFGLDLCNLCLSEGESQMAKDLCDATNVLNVSSEIRDETIPMAERAALQEKAESDYRMLLPEQKAVHDAVTRAISKEEQACIFLDAPGGTGKTFTFNAILASLRSQGKIALAVASSGIAAILLDMGRTFHSRFKAPRDPGEDQMLNIKAQTNLAELLRVADVIIWDEAAMGNKYSLEALDATLKDLMKPLGFGDAPFGGKTILLGGDYRQTLPIVKGASRAQTIRTAISRSFLWKEFSHFHLTKNMRIEKVRESLQVNESSAAARLLQELDEFGSWLLKLGEGKLQSDNSDLIEIPRNMCLEEGCSIDSLIDWVYPNLHENCTSATWLSERAVLAPLHVDVNEINDKMTADFPGEAWTLHSADEMDPTTPKVARVATEVLNSCNSPGLPMHKLHLKKNMPIMLMRNLRPERGLCNGTRLIVKNILGTKEIEAEIATGKHQGKIVFIPRITLSADEGTLPFAWARRQFPVKVAFAMTINKAQGQTLERVGVYLKNRCFAHGQLYVAASRVGHSSKIRFALDPDANGQMRTCNIVFEEILTL